MTCQESVGKTDLGDHIDIDVSDGVANGHEESIMNEQDSGVNYQESLQGDSGTTMCISGGTAVLPNYRCRNSCKPCMHCSVDCPVGVLTEGANFSL